MLRNRYDNRSCLNVKIVTASVLLLIVTIYLALTSITIVGPNERGVRVTLGKASEHVVNSGIIIKWPLISKICIFSVATQNSTANLDVFSKDLQSVEMQIDVIYHYAPEKVVKLVTDFQSNPIKTVLTPLVHETLKEICKDLNSEEIVQRREYVSQKANALLSTNISKYDIFTIERLVITNVELSPKLNQAIESKMIQEQEAQKAQFT